MSNLTRKPIVHHIELDLTYEEWIELRHWAFVASNKPNSDGAAFALANKVLRG